MSVIMILHIQISSLFSAIYHAISQSDRDANYIPPSGRLMFDSDASAKTWSRIATFSNSQLGSARCLLPFFLTTRDAYDTGRVSIIFLPARCKTEFTQLNSRSQSSVLHL